MAYTKTVWVNNQAPAINADNLNKIEQGIFDTDAGVAAANSRIDKTNRNVTALTTEVGKKTVSYAIQVTLTSAGWSGGAQTVSATHVTATNSVIVSPIPAHQDAYSTAGILCTEQAAGTLKFTCTSDPTSNITVNVYIAE